MILVVWRPCEDNLLSCFSMQGGSGVHTRNLAAKHRRHRNIDRLNLSLKRRHSFRGRTSFCLHVRLALLATATSLEAWSRDHTLGSNSIIIIPGTSTPFHDSLFAIFHASCRDGAPSLGRSSKSVAIPLVANTHTTYSFSRRLL